MRSGSPLAAALLLAVLLASGVPVEAAHPQDARVAQFLDAWLAAASAKAGPTAPTSTDRSLLELLRENANRSTDRRIFTLGGVDNARYASFGDYAQLVPHQPVDNGSQESRRAQRFWWMNQSIAMRDAADTNLSAARVALKAFEPRTVDGLEWGILAGRLLVSAHLSLAEDFPAAQQAVEALRNPEPDTTTSLYRSAIHKLVASTAGSNILVAEAREVLEHAKARDAAGGRPLAPQLYKEVLDAYKAASESPTTTGPAQLPFAFRARDAFRQGETVFGLAAFLLFDEVRVKQAYEFRQQTNSIDLAGIQQARDRSAARVEGDLNATADQRLPGLLLRDAAAYARTFDALTSVARLDAATNMHANLVKASGAGGSTSSTDLTPLVVGGAGLVVAGVGAWIWLRRK